MALWLNSRQEPTFRNQEILQRWRPSGVSTCYLSLQTFRPLRQYPGMVLDLSACTTRVRQTVNLRKGNMEKHEYKAPKLVTYGPIADHTFNTPGGVKGCQTNC